MFYVEDLRGPVPFLRRHITDVIAMSCILEQTQASDRGKESARAPGDVYYGANDCRLVRSSTWSAISENFYKKTSLFSTLLS